MGTLFPKVHDPINAFVIFSQGRTLLRLFLGSRSAGNPSWYHHIGVSPSWLYSVSTSLGCVDLATDVISIRGDREGLFCGSRVGSSVESRFSSFCFRNISSRNLAWVLPPTGWTSSLCLQGVSAEGPPPFPPPPPLPLPFMPQTIRLLKPLRNLIYF